MMTSSGFELQQIKVKYFKEIITPEPHGGFNYQNGIKDEASLRWPPTSVIRMTFNYVRKCNQKKTNIGYVLIKHREADS